LALCVSGDHMWASTVQLSYRPLPVRGDRTSRLYRLLTKLAAIATWRELRCSTVSDPGCKSAPHARRRSSEAAAEAYAADLRNALGDDGRLDLVLLGLGQDAHAASLFPGLAAVTETRRAVWPSWWRERTRRASCIGCCKGRGNRPCCRPRPFGRRSGPPCG